MTDYIRRGVELADGWKWLTADDGAPYIHGPNQLNVTLIPSNPQQVWLDALAAQLVRQVDALAPDVVFTTGFHGEAFIYREATDDDWGAGEMKGRGDRTMNTIKAIVDSGVLE